MIKRDNDQERRQRDGEDLAISTSPTKKIATDTSATELETVVLDVWQSQKVEYVTAAGRPVSHPVMGHHNHIVEPANNAFAPPPLPPSASAKPHSSPPLTTLRDVIGTTAAAGRNQHNTNNSNSNDRGAAGNCTGATSTIGPQLNLTGAVTAAMQNGTAVPDRPVSDYYYYYAYDNTTETALFFPLNGSAVSGRTGPFEKSQCQWIPAQQSLFQFSNICFLTAFIVPRSYKLSVLSLRALLFLGFLLSGLWASTDVCAMDALIWYGLLALINGVHALKLCKKLMPPALSVELMELYTRVFKPLKVSEKHFRELTREAAIEELSPGECYAVEAVTACDQRLSILLRGRCAVTCEGTQLHNISSYQFIDSPEWMASTLMHGENMFQVTITAAEDCVYLCWQLSKLNRIFKHRIQLHAVLTSIIGKDITHKMYSLNEQLGQAKSFDDQTRAARNDHWRQAIYRSVSYDAVNTGTKGTVRSNAWKRYRDRKASLFADPGESPVHGPRRCWIPVLTNQLSDSTTAYASMDGQSPSADEEQEPMLSGNHQSVDIPLYRLGGQQQTAAALASIPAIALKAAGLEFDADAAQRPRRPSTLRRQNSNVSNREVIFDETVL